MRRVVPTLAVLSGLSLLMAPASLAQLPAVTPTQAAQGVKVASVTFEPSGLNLERGDTVRIRAILRDADGQAVEGALVFVYSQNPSVISPQIGRLSPEGTIELQANGPGEVSPLVFVRVNDADGSFRGTPGIKQVGTFDVMVHDWPVDHIEVAKEPYQPYVGTSMKLTGKAMTSHGTEHTSAVVLWTSETPGIAGVTAGGVVTFLKPGEARLVARTEGGKTASESFRTMRNPITQLSITPRLASARTGDVVRFTVRALDAKGRPVEGVALSYSTYGIDSAGAEIFPDGAFVADNPGSYRVLVTAGGLAAEALVEAAPRPATPPVELLGRGKRKEVATSDLWVFTGKDGRDYAYTGTHASGGGQRMFVWDVTNPREVQLMDSVVVDARVVNDVKVNDDASWAVITREGASDRKNGLVVLDLSAPAHPKVIAELTEPGMTGGMHNTWIVGHMVYGVNDGRSGMDIVDMSDPTAPKHVGFFEIRPGESNKTLHDIWGDGKGYLYLSYWDDGLVIADVGAGTHGGTPTDPKVVSRIAYGQGNTHVAWRERNYVFLGDEIFGCAECINGPRGYIHVIDVADIEHPREVAKFEVPEAGTHNIWVEDGILYIAYYQGGLRVVDVSGELRGDLYRQGRQIGWFPTSAPADDALVANSPMAWGPQPFKGNVFVSDMNSGLWILKAPHPEPLTP